MVREVLSSKNPKMRLISKPVGKIDKKIKDIIADLKDTLGIQKDPEGVGLAAPQIGKNLRIFFMKHAGVEKIVINPEIIEVKKVTQSQMKKEIQSNSQIMEGCLSLPHYYGPLTRSSFVKLSYMTEAGEKTVEEFKGFFAQIVLHEVDHLNGIMFLDRLIEQNQPLYKLHKNKWEEVELI